MRRPAPGTTTRLCMMWLCLFLCVSPADGARAEPGSELDATYSDHVHAALAAYDAGELARAKTEFELAHARYANARTLRGLGTVALELHDYVGAAEHLERALASDELPLEGALREVTTAGLREANEHVGRVQLIAFPASAQASIDGRPVALDTTIVLAPRAYRLELSAPGYERHERVLSVLASQSQLVQLVLQPSPAAAAVERIEPSPAPGVSAPFRAPHSHSALRPWLSIAVGGAVFVAGAALLGKGLSDRALVKGSDDTSLHTWERAEARYPRLTAAGATLLGVGALSVLVGFWWRARDRSVREQRVRIGPAGVGARF